MNTKSLRSQHVELMQCLHKLSEATQRKEPGVALRGALVELSGKLTMHLAAEDRLLYPALAGCSNASTAALAQRYAEEMGGLAAAFRAFSARFATGAIIDEHRADFADKLQQVANAVTARVAAEERELYPASDALGA